MVLVNCIITCYKKDPSKIIDNMLNQTKKSKLIVVSSEIDLMPLLKKYPKVKFVDVPNEKDWGHSKRALGLSLADRKYVCFVNDDDYYEPNYIELMSWALEQDKADLVYCVWKDKTLKGWFAEPGLKLGGITSGSIMVRTEKAQKVGWKHRVYASDWYFVRDLLNEGVRVVYLPYSLMEHL